MRLAQAETTRLLRVAQAHDVWQCCCAAAAAAQAASPLTATHGSTQHGGGDETAGGSAEASALAALHALTTDEMVAALHALATFVADADAVPSYAQLVMPRVRVDVAMQVAQGLLQAYRIMHTALYDPANGFDSGEARVKAPEQVAALLGFDEDADG